MSRENRLRLIKDIELARNSKVLCYITGDRRGFETKIAPDVFSFIYDHLSKMIPTKSIDLFLYSTGGITIAGWGLVNLVREFCDKFSVIIPFKAHSCATLIALGADEIIMSKLGQLTPIDPSVTSPYNPPAPGPTQPGFVQLLPVSAEDVIGYFNLAREEAKLEDTGSLAIVFKDLSEKVHPMALGSVYRSRQQINILAEKLLSFHVQSKEKRDRIISMLTKELFSHDYLISRKEAKEVIKLNIVNTPRELEEKIWLLYREYEVLLELNIPYSPEVFLGNESFKIGVFRRAIIESTEEANIFITKKEIRRAQIAQPGVPTPVEGFQERIIEEGWVKENI